MANPNPSSTNKPNGDDDMDLLISAHHREFLSAAGASSDLDLAFRLQLQEAISASLSHVPSTSSPPIIETEQAESNTNSDLSYVLTLQALELERFHQEKRDSEIQALELKRVTHDLRLRTHDEKLAREIDSMPDDDWEEFGDNLERPIDPSPSTNPNPNQKYEDQEQPYRLYFKGMASMDLVKGNWVHLAAIGVAVCDPKDNLLLKIQKPVQANGSSRKALEAKALIEGLNATLSLGIKSVNVFFDYKVLYNHVLGIWAVKQRNIANLINQISLLQRKFNHCKMYLLPRCHVRFVFQLARDAIDSQIARSGQPESSSHAMGHKETCIICLELTDSTEMFSVDNCSHRFCFSCMKQHVEVKLLHGMLPFCPHEGCNTRLNVESSRRFLTPKLLDIMVQRLKEESIPPAQKVYCPNPRCSALMSLTEAIKPKLQDVSSISSCSKRMVLGGDTSGLRKCVKCEGLFCVNCRVMWHEGIGCAEYKRRNPNPRPEEAKLQSLARQKLWRQCVKCKHMIELAEGCFHMTCRCGYEFCYTCGKEWKDKKATCSCPLWDEGYIWYDDTEEDDDEDDDDDDDFYDDEDEDDFYDYDDDDDDHVEFSNVFPRHYLGGPPPFNRPPNNH